MIEWVSIFISFPVTRINLFSRLQKVFDIIHPARRNLTAIRGYVRLGGLPDNPRTDPQDRTWFGPHDRLFIEEESQPIEFQPGPSHGTSPLASDKTYIGLIPPSVWCWGWDGAGDLDGPDVDPIWERMSNVSTRRESVTVKHDRSIVLGGGVGLGI